MRRIGGELIAGVGHIACRGSVADGVIGECLSRAQERMACRGEPIQVVVPEILAATAIRHARPVAHAVIGIGGLIDRGPTGPELMENLGHLRRGIIPEPLCNLVTG